MNSGDHKTDAHDATAAAPKKASVGQVAATMFWGLVMIGKRGTWERNGATITLKQAVIGAVVAGCVVVFVLMMLVRLAVG